MSVAGNGSADLFTFYYLTGDYFTDCCDLEVILQSIIFFQPFSSTGASNIRVLGFSNMQRTVLVSFGFQACRQTRKQTGRPVGKRCSFCLRIKDVFLAFSLCFFLFGCCQMLPDLHGKVAQT